MVSLNTCKSKIMILAWLKKYWKIFKKISHNKAKIILKKVMVAEEGRSYYNNNPLRPKIHTQILQSGVHTFP